MYTTSISNELELKEIYHLMISGISPRPIAFVGSKSSSGIDNLAPFSYFNGFGSNPPIIGFSPANSGRTGEKKDTLVNIERTKEFTVSIVNSLMVEQMSLTSCDYESIIDEFIKGGFKKKKSHTVDCSSVDKSPFIMECKLKNIIELGGKPGSGNLILGEVICFHVRNDILDKKNKIDPYLLDPVSRLGDNFYSTAKEGLFEVLKPKDNGIGFDNLPDEIKNSKLLSGNELAKLAGVKSLPTISKNKKLDKMSLSELYDFIIESLLKMKVDEAWQAALRITMKNE